MRREGIGMSVYVFIGVLAVLGVLAEDGSTQEIPGTLVFEEPFEFGAVTSGWYTAGAGTLTPLGAVEVGAGGVGDSMVLYVEDPGTALNHNQYTIEFPMPDNAWLYEWRVTFDIWVDTAPFVIRPILAMSVDPWTGTGVAYQVTQAEEWVSVDVTIPAGDFLTTDTVLFIWHMGGNNAFEVRLDNLKVYLLDQVTLVSRTIADQTLVPDEGREVLIELLAPEGTTTDATVTETPPPGWPVSNISVSAGDASVNAQGQIVWTLSGVTGSHSLTYVVTPPADTLFGVFEGTLEIAGTSSPILGDAMIQQEIPFAHINDPNPVPFELVNGEAFIEAEDAYLVISPPDGPEPFEIRADPTASGQLYVYALLTNTTDDSLLGNELDFVFRVVEPGIYRVIARTRTPSGDDDSFYVGMDDDLGDDNATYRFQGSGIQDDEFHISWVFVDGDAAQGYTEWDLDAGVHTLRFNVREDRTQLDWIVITNNLDQDPTAYVPPTVTSVPDFMLR